MSGRTPENDSMATKSPCDVQRVESGEKLPASERVTDHFIKQLKWHEVIIPNIVFTKQGILANKTLIEMIDSLLLTGSIENKYFYNFIKTNYKLPISVLIKNNDDPKEKGKINTIFNYSLPLDLKKIKSTSQLGVFICLNIVQVNLL